MTLLLLSLIVGMLVSVTVQQAGKLDFDIHVKQDETRYIQTVSSNMYENMVYYHTPKHNHTSETHLMQDFNQGHLILGKSSPERLAASDDVLFIQILNDRLPEVKVEGSIWISRAYIDIGPEGKYQTFTFGYYLPGKNAIQIRCFPELKHCYLSDLEQAEYTNATVTIENVAKMWKQGINSINSDKSEKIVHRWGINGSEITNVVFLSSPVRLFLRRFNYPLFRVIKLPQDANIFQGDNKRNQKRAVESSVGVPTRKCQNGKLAESRWVATSGHCEHLYVCKNEHVHCQNLHIFGAPYFQCFCCDEHTLRSQCHSCTRINV